MRDAHFKKEPTESEISIKRFPVFFLNENSQYRQSVAIRMIPMITSSIKNQTKIN
jgi:hypothetical protein